MAKVRPTWGLTCPGGLTCRGALSGKIGALSDPNKCSQGISKHSKDVRSFSISKRPKRRLICAKVF